MKRLAAFLMLGVLSLTISACGNREASEESGTREQTAGTVQESTGATRESTGASQESVGATRENEVGSGTGEASLGEDGWSAEMENVKAAVVEALDENYWPDMPIPAELMEALYGITADMYDDYLGEMPMISANVDTLLIVRAKSDKVDDVEDALMDYRKALVNDTMQYPRNLGIIQASRIERIGNYVCFVQLGGYIVDEDDIEVTIALCRELNELVIEIIRQNIQQD